MTRGSGLAPAARYRNCPVCELLLETHAFEVRCPRLEVFLRVRDRLVVDGRADLPEEIVEEGPGLQVADLLLEILGDVALDGGNKQRPGFRRDSDGLG